MNSVKIITAIYSNLHGTEYGGQPDRKERYKYGLLNLLNMSNADFLCYTSEEETEELYDFFYKQHQISENRLQIKPFSLSNTKSRFLINRYKDVESIKRGFRSYEIQYNKFHWWWNEDKKYEYYFWFDAGICDGDKTVPKQYLNDKNQIIFFNNKFIENLIDLSKDKIFVMGKENIVNFWYPTVSSCWFTKPYSGYHIIGGVFGGHICNWKWLVRTFEEYLYEIAFTEHRLYFEEQIMSLIYTNNPEKFTIKKFDTWWFKGYQPEGEFDIEWFKQNGPQDDEYYNGKKCYHQVYKELSQ